MTTEAYQSAIQNNGQMLKRKSSDMLRLQG